MPIELARPVVGKKKAAPKTDPKRYGSLIRVSDDFAEAIRKVCSIENVSAADFVDSNFLPALQKHYRGLLAKEAQRMQGDDPA